VKGKNISDITLLKTLTKRKWGPKRDRVIQFLVRDDEAFEQISPLVGDAEWVNTFSYLVELHAQAAAVRAANAARNAIDEVINAQL
jgi:hypothetical protein